MQTNITYLNTAGCGLLSEKALQAGNELYTKFMFNSSGTAENWNETGSVKIRKTIADFLRVKENGVAMIPNFSYAMNALVHSLKGNEKVLLYRNDYPSLTIPFVINGFDIIWLDDEDGFLIDINKIENLVKQHNIDVVALSHVQWHSGFMIDLEKLSSVCQENDAWLFVDGTQSLGAFDINVAELSVDVFIASNYKWMNGGFGTGILYINEEFIKTYPPAISGNNSKTFLFTKEKFSYDASVKNYEPGHLNQFGFTILQKAIEEKNAIGLQTIAENNKKLTQKLLNEIAELPVEIIGEQNTDNRASIVILKDKKGLHDFLQKRNIITTSRNGTVRISIHFTNSEKDTDTIVKAINEWAK